MFLSLSINIFYFASSLRMISTFRMITKIIKQLIIRNKEIDIDEYICMLGQEILYIHLDPSSGFGNDLHP